MLPDKSSTRHHYIPAFYSKGFTNRSGFFYVYDKQADEISKKERSPKSIFFENDRNTIVLDKETSILEDLFFKELDNRLKVAIENLREKPNCVELLSNENSADVDLFVLNLFWRVPKTDFAFDRYFREAKIVFTSSDGNNVSDEILENRLKNDESYKKIQRAFLPVMFLRSYLDATKNKSKLYYQLFEKAEDCFLIGDYPMIFSRTPSTVEDLFGIDYYLPISSNRLYYSGQKERELKFDYDKVGRLNVVIIDQSHRYVCGPDFDYLKKCVDYYKALKTHGFLFNARQKVFR
jgi:Protein of unknown function (DUF4238)